MKRSLMRFFAADNHGGDGAPVSSEPAAEAAPNGEAAPAADANTTGGDSSGAPNADANADPKTLLDAIRPVVGDQDGKVSSTDPKVTVAPEVKPVANTPAPELDEKAQAEADKALPFHSHPRWQQVTTQNREFKAQASAMKPLADEQMVLQNFMRENDIPAEDIAFAYNFLKAMKTDPLEARKMLEGVWNQLSEFSGEVLPKDLADRVKSGHLDEDAAKEIARLRHTQAFTKTRTEAEQRRIDGQKQVDQQQQVQRTVYTAGANWENQQRQTDPDYAKKASLVETHAAAIMQREGRPDTAEKALSILDRAKAAVDKLMSEIAPVTRQPTARRPSSASSTPAAKTVPTSLLEATRQAASIPT